MFMKSRNVLSALCVSRLSAAFMLAPVGRRVSAAPLSTARGDIEAIRGDGIGGEGVILQPTGGAKPDAVVVWLHGLGDTAMGWAPAMPQLKLKGVKFILPTAEERSISINGGMPMPGWFDIFGLDPSSPEDSAGFAESAERVHALIHKEVLNGTPLSKIALCGFSQGGALAMHVALRYGKKESTTKVGTDVESTASCADGANQEQLAGCVALSGWLPLRADYPAALAANAQQLPIFMGHGDSDPVVPLQWAQVSHRAMIKEQTKGEEQEEAKPSPWSGALGLEKVTFKEYPGMGHSACDEELAHVGAFLNKVLQ